MSGTVCSFSGCKKSYSQDKDVSFFCFPEDPKRRKKWMQNCGNPELDNLPDRQLRRLRLCSDHFLPSNFIRPESRTALNDSAVPLIAKAEPAKQTQDKKKVEEETPKKRGRGRQSAVIQAEKDDETPDVEVSKEEKQVVTHTPTLRGRRRKETPSSEPAEKEKEVVFAVKSKAVTPTKPKDSAVPPKTDGIDAVASGIVKRKTRTDVAPSAPQQKEVKVSSPDANDSTKKPRKLLTQKTPPVETQKVNLDLLGVPRLIAKTEPAKQTQDKKKVEEETPKKRGRGRQSAVIPAGKDGETPDVEVAKEEKQVTALSPTLRGRRRKETPSSEPAEKEKEAEKEVAVAVKSKAVTPTKPKDSAVPPKTDGMDAVALGIVKRKTRTDVAPGAPQQKKVKVSSPDANDSTKKPRKLLTQKKPPVETQKVNLDLLGVPRLIAKTDPAKQTQDKKKVEEETPKKRGRGRQSAVIPTDKDGETPDVEVAKEEKQVTNTPSSESAEKGKEVTFAVKSKAVTPTKPKESAVPPKTDGMNAGALGIVKKKKRKNVAPGAPQQKKVKVSGPNDASDSTKKPRKLLTQKKPPAETQKVNLELLGVPRLKLHTPSEPTSAKIVQHVRADDADRVDDSDSFDDEDMLYDRDFMESYAEDESDARPDREFERFYTSLKKFLHLSGRWTMGGVQWDPQGKRKVIIVSEPELPPNGRPTVKRCLQFFEDKYIRVFIDGMDMTDVFGMTCYAEKEDVAALISRVAEASTCCGVPEMVVEDLVHFPNTKKRSCAYFDSECPGIIPNDSFESVCLSCKQLRELVLETREKEKNRLQERRIRSQEKDFTHPFGEALYTLFTDLVDETDPTKPRKRKQKETFFRKFLTDTRYKINGDTTRTERIYVEKPISVDAVSASFQDIVSKLGFCMPNSQKNKTPGSSIPRSVPTSAPTPRPSRLQSSTSNIMKVERKHQMQVEHILPFTPGSSFTLDDGQEYELIGEVDSSTSDFMEMKPTPAQPQYEIIEVDDETLAKITSAKNQVVMLPESTSSPSNLQVTRIDANDPNLSQILKAINTSHGFKVT